MFSSGSPGLPSPDRFYMVERFLILPDLVVPLP